MGTVTGVNIVYNDGSSLHAENTQRLDFFDEAYRVEFEYDYGPHLSPTQHFSDEGMWRYQQLLPFHFLEMSYVSSKDTLCL